jgi:glucose-6-phosphate 1-epimerase
MEALSVEKLNQQFAINSSQTEIRFTHAKGNIPVVEIANKQATAQISLQGAHLLSWVPEGEDEVIWLSTEAIFKNGKSVRGGIPICWPWFGAHDQNSTYPAHGFARTELWEIISTQQLASGETQIGFRLNSASLDETVQKMFPLSTAVEYTLTVGASLKLELTSTNNGSADIVIGEALHTYFNIGDIRNAHVSGLDGKDYLDKPDNFKSKKQSGDISIDGEVDRVYINTQNDVVIDNRHRKIIIQKQGSQSTIVWNPGKQVAEKMADLGEEGYLQMLCVESANAADNVETISAGESHTLQVVYKIQKK